MHPKEGQIYRVNDDGVWIWERPRTRREAGTFWTSFIVGVIAAVPFVVALVFILT